MPVNHRVMRLVFAFGVGLVAASGSFLWITDTDRSARRAQEEAIVFSSRDILRSYIPDDGLEISDAVDRVREAGKVYFFPTDSGWEISGHYRRPGEKGWHAFLMSVDGNASLVSLSVQDTDMELTRRAAFDPKFSTSR